MAKFIGTRNIALHGDIRLAKVEVDLFLGVLKYCFLCVAVYLIWQRRSVLQPYYRRYVGLYHPIMCENRDGLLPVVRTQQHFIPIM